MGRRASNLSSLELDLPPQLPHPESDHLITHHPRYDENIRRLEYFITNCHGNIDIFKPDQFSSHLNGLDPWVDSRDIQSIMVLVVHQSSFLDDSRASLYFWRYSCRSDSDLSSSTAISNCCISLWMISQSCYKKNLFQQLLWLFTIVSK